MSGAFPGRSSLDVTKLGEVPSDWFAKEGYIKISSFRVVAFKTVENAVDAIGKLCPVCVEATSPTGCVATEQPVLVGMRPKAKASLAPLLTGARPF